MKIALKVDVDTYRGTVEGVPALVKLFDRYQVHATFLFSLGPDHTGRALRRIFRPGFLRKVSRTSVAEHYGYKTLMYGVLLPGPHIGRKAGHLMRDAGASGHELGIHCYDHVRWQDFVANKDFAWTQREMVRAYDAFVDATGTKPSTLGAAGWQINKHALALEETMGFAYASDTRGASPFFPIIDDVSSNCVQIPTTLPTLDELIGCNGITATNVHDEVFRQSTQPDCDSHVYTLHAELEGMKLLPVMENLLRAWKNAGIELTTMQGLYNELTLSRLPRQHIVMREIAGRSGNLAVQEESQDRAA